MSTPRRRAAAKKRASPRQPVKKKKTTEPGPEPRVHLRGRTAAVQAGTSDKDVAAALTGEDQLPGMGGELGRPAGRPDFDPHARDDDAEPEREPNYMTMMVFLGDGDDFEDRVKSIVAYAEGQGMFYLNATIGLLDEESIIDFLQL